MTKRAECTDRRPCALRDGFWGCRALEEAMDPPCRFAKPTLDSMPYDLGPRQQKQKPGYTWDFVKVKV